jgi:hypothetical protein
VGRAKSIEKGGITMMATGTGSRANKTGNKKHSQKKRNNDLYETPEVGVHALLRYAEIPLTIWEPACGRNLNIVRVLRGSGRDVIATDLIDYRWMEGSQAIGGVDFLDPRLRAPSGIDCILTNPPFSKAQEFVAQARRLCPRVIMLLRLAFMESECRCDILDAGDLKKVLVFRKRLPMMHRDGWEGKKANSGMAFAWFDFDREFTGDTIIKRISWERPEYPGGIPPAKIEKERRKRRGNGTLQLAL